MPQSIAVLPVLITAIGVVAVAIAALRGKRAATAPQEFSCRFDGPVPSKAERSFFDGLRRAAGDDFVIFAKIRIADVLTPTRDRDRSVRRTALNKILSKHFDFVVCSSDRIEPLCAIELDDSSHRRAARRRTDRRTRPVMAGKRPKPRPYAVERSRRFAVCGLLWLAGAAGGVDAASGRPPNAITPAEHAAHAPPNDQWEGAHRRDRRALDVPSEIGVLITPELEHWPGNYVPDGYRLDDYDGRRGSGAGICVGRHTRRWSTADPSCPAGQKPEAGGRRLSTDDGDDR